VKGRLQVSRILEATGTNRKSGSKYVFKPDFRFHPLQSHCNPRLRASKQARFARVIFKPEIRFVNSFEPEIRFQRDPVQNRERCPFSALTVKLQTENPVCTNRISGSNGWSEAMIPSIISTISTQVATRARLQH
jgi:hypothetical protein